MKEDYLLINKRYFASDMEKAIESMKNQFRSKHNIKSDAHVIFIAPGNEKSEVEFCLENLRKGGAIAGSGSSAVNKELEIKIKEQEEHMKKIEQERQEFEKRLAA